MAEGSERCTFSQVKSHEKLTSLFGLKYVTTLSLSPEKASRSGLWRMLGLTEAEWATVCQMFAVFFRRATNLPRSSVKGPLGRVFEFMFSVLRKESSADPLFNNSAGKLFIYELFTTIPDRNLKVAISTTSNPYTDWCGIYQEGVVSGVVDVLVRPLDPTRRQPVIIGEVKGASGSYTMGLWQVVAAMQTTANFCKVWPIGMSMHEVNKMYNGYGYLCCHGNM